MMHCLPSSPHSVLRRAILSTLATVSAAALTLGAAAQSALPNRLSANAASTARATVEHTGSADRIRGAAALGHLSGDTQLTRMVLTLAPSADQQAALTQLLADQQNPASPSYHRWLTPAQFGAKFGASDADIAVLRNWLQTQGMTVYEVPASRNALVFSGTSSLAEAAFNVSLDRYSIAGKEFFANSADVSLPSGLSGIVAGVRGLNSYRLAAPMAKRAAREGAASPDYTSTSTGNHYLVPWDFRQIYGMNTLISSGYDGTGVKVAVIGQSAVSTTQIGYFQTLTGQTQKVPTLVLEPGTGTSTAYAGDEGESEIDIEYAGGSAPGDSVVFVYTGNGNYGVFDALVYAIQQNSAPIITMSYGECENTATSDSTTLEPYLRQANAQGQTVLISSGDSGAATCDQDVTTGIVATQGLSVAYPASSPQVTGVGGTQLNSDASTYWSSTNNSYRGSAIGYIPETSWNDTAAAQELSASAGGYSHLFGKPSWQTGTGVPADGHRDVPDVAFSASQEEHGYLVCSAELTSTGAASGEACTATTFGSYVFGGTSLASPNFAGMLAIIEQANKSTGLGNINTSLYTLGAGTQSTAVFHDITTGNNIVACTGGTLGCSSTTSGTNGTMGYSATTGYDEVTGLGSIAAPALQTALAGLASTTTTTTPTLSLTSSNTAPTVSTSVVFTATVAAASGSTTPTGTVTFAVDGTTVGSAVTLSSGVATYTYAGFATTGSHTVTATYSGDTNYAAVTGTLSLTVSTTTTTTAAGSITLASAPSTVTVTAGSSGTTTLTVTSVNSYAGSVAFTAAVTSGTLTSSCYTAPNATVTANSTATSTFTIYTSSSACATVSAQGQKVVALGTAALTSSKTSMPLPLNGKAMLVVAAGLLCCIGLRKRSRIAVSLFAALLSVLLFGASGCGSGGGTQTATNASPGTYTIQVTGTTSTAVAATTIFTVTVQ